MIVKAVDLEVGMDVAGVGIIVEILEVDSEGVSVNVAANPDDGYNLDDYDTVDQYWADIDEELEVLNR